MISLRDVITGFGNRDPLAEVWRRDIRGGGGGAAEITGVPPLRYIGDGRPLTDYRISGNTLQDGTPSADAPVDAEGCGAWDEAQQSFKLPLTVNGVEYPIYLGQVETTRRIKKIEISVNRIITLASGYAGAVSEDFMLPALSGIGFCDVASYGGTSAVNSFYVNRRNTVFVLNAGTALEDAKELLNGHFVWYVLAEPETAIVNEPLMKIGDYADTVSFAQAGVTIPTVNGENVLDVQAEVKPSEITIKGGISSV